MPKKITLNFWNALLMIFCIQLIPSAMCALAALIFKDFYDISNDGFKEFLMYIETLLSLPFIFWSIKKTGTNIKDSFVLPDSLTLIKMFVTVLLLFIILRPFDHFDSFYEALLNSKIRIPNTTTKPFFTVFSLKIILLVPIIEELFFRGLVLKSFLKKYSPLYAILLSSFLFGIFHASLYYLIYYTLLGILFGLLYYSSNSLVTSILAHISYNACCLFNSTYIDFNTTNTINVLSIYLTTIGILFLLLKEPFKALRT